MAGCKLNVSYVQDPSVVGNARLVERQGSPIDVIDASEAVKLSLPPPFQGGCELILQSKKLKNKNRNYMNIKTITK